MTELQKEVTDLSRATDQGFQRLAYEIARLEKELHHSRERETDARERLRLEIENRLLKETRQLPPSTDKQQADDAE